MSAGSDRQLLGFWGEEQVARYLRKKGCVIQASRWRCRLGELDLVASDAKYLRIVEVKLRKDSKLYTAREAVDRRKQEKLRAAAELYLAQNPTRLQPRFDVAEVYAPMGMTTERPEIHYIEDAF